MPSDKEATSLKSGVWWCYRRQVQSMPNAHRAAGGCGHARASGCLDTDLNTTATGHYLMTRHTTCMYSLIATLDAHTQKPSHHNKTQTFVDAILLQKLQFALKMRPASWSSGQSFWLLIMRSRVRFPVLPWGFSLKEKIPMVTMVWVV
jgi:hypothetical protein